MMLRRTLGAAALLLALLPTAFAQTGQKSNFPTKPLKIVVPTGPGGGADVMMRAIAQSLAKRLGQQVVVENRSGADGVIAAQYVMSAPPDGYTLMLGTNTAMVLVPALRPNPPYDPFKAFTPIGSLGQFSIYLLVPSSLPVKSVKELQELTAANPDKYTSASTNSAAELAMLQVLGGAKVLNVRYKSELTAYNDMVGGQIHMIFGTMGTARTIVADGRARALVTTQPTRSPLMPDVPTAAELGLGQLTITPWAGLYGPAGMPPEVVARLSDELQQVLQQPDVKEQLANVGFAPQPMPAAGFATYYRQMHDGFVKLVRDRGIKFD